MALHAVDKIIPGDYIPECERESESPTVFKLRPLDGMQYMEVMAELTRDANGNYKLTGRGMKLTIQHGLVGWDNFLDAQGKVLKFNSVNIPKIRVGVLSELASEILERSQLDEDDQKN